MQKYIERDTYSKQLTHVIMEAGKSQNLQGELARRRQTIVRSSKPKGLRTRKAGEVIRYQMKADRLRTQSPPFGSSLKAGKKPTS